MTQQVNPKVAQKVGDERRAFKRFPVKLEAVLTGQNGRYVGIVRDFCIGGMFLAVNDSAANNDCVEDGAISVTCKVPSAGQLKSVEFAGYVVRNKGNGVALRFEDPDLASLQLLQAFAKQTSVENQIVEKSASSDSGYSSQLFNHKSAEKLVRFCEKTVQSYSDILITRFYQGVADYLFELSKATRDMAEQNTYFEALKTINSTRDTVRVEFIDVVEKHLADYSPEQMQRANIENEKMSLGSLSIVEDDAFDDWLADAATIDSIESRYREELSAIERRLSIVFDVDISNENNPYGPGVFSRSFHQVVKPLGMRHKVNLACYTVFRDVLLDRLGTLYNRINAYLIENDVLPVIEYKVAKPIPEPESVKKTTISVDADLGAIIGDALEGGGFEKPSANDAKKSRDKRSDQGDQDLYQLFGDLRELQQQLSKQIGGQVSGKGVRNSDSVDAVAGSVTNVDDQADNDHSNASVENFNVADIAGALSRLKTIPKKGADKQSARDYRDEVIKLLSEGVGDQGSGKAIGVREGQIMDVASNLFHTMSADQQISEKVHQWIDELELPLLKMAITDDALFTDRDHLVRQVINKIAQLEVLVEGIDESGQSSVRKAIAWIIDLVNKEFDGSTEVFARAVQQLDLLLRVQDRTYSSKLEQVIALSREEEAQLLAGGQPLPLVEWTEVEPQEKAIWVKRVHRLKEGDWVVFGEGGSKQERLRIAWIATQTQRIVFVDALGERAKMLDFITLAREMYHGNVSVLDNAKEPALDRAQYSMLQDLHSQLLHQSTHDQLTGLMNRREFVARLESSLYEAKHENNRHVVCFIGLDKFNVINNVCSYAGGDQMLREISAMFVEQLGDRGAVARLGSDEFGLLIQDCTIDDSLDFIEECLEELQEYRLVWEGNRLGIGCSVGLVPLSRRSEDAGDVLQSAESSCGVAKEMGGNRVQVYHSAHAGLSRRKQVMEWAAQIDRILDEESLFLRCQSIVPINPETHTKQHYEILLGVLDLDGANISTPEFIEAAERYNRMPDVDRWVVKNSLRWISRNGITMENVEMFSINLSGLSVNDEGFLKFIIEQIETSKVPVEKICFEVTETAGVGNLTDASEFIRQVKKTGCQFSLDDFGTGMSSYAYLKNLPVDFLKIDGAFVKDMVNSKSDYAVVKSICEIGHFMGLEVIAEYVENDEILALLREIGVDFAQGFGIEKPHPLDELSSKH